MRPRAWPRDLELILVRSRARRAGKALATRVIQRVATVATGSLNHADRCVGAALDAQGPLTLAAPLDAKRVVIGLGVARRADVASPALRTYHVVAVGEDEDLTASSIGRRDCAHERVLVVVHAKALLAVRDALDVMDRC